MTEITLALIDLSYFPVYQDSFAGIQRELAGERGVKVLLRQNQGTLEKTLEGFSGQGVLGSMVFPDADTILRQHHLKTVSILRGGACFSGPCVSTDQVGSGMRIAEHFIERGHEHIGFFSAGGKSYSPRYEQGVQEACMAADTRFSLFTIGPRTRKRGTWHPEDQRGDFLDWLTSEQPTALAAADEDHARRTVEFCREAGIRIPEDLAVCACLGNPLTCDFYDPPLSALHGDMPAVGATAFRLLVNWIRNPEQHPPAETILEEGELRIRRSSDLHAVKDPAIRKALHYIDHHLEENPGVEDLARICGMSRRTLERKFEGKLGYTPAQAVRQSRERLARDLLSYSDLPLQEIAFRCGLQHASQLSRLTRERFGSTPTELRNHSGV